jgi:hypothetical protein
MTASNTTTASSGAPKGNAPPQQRTDTETKSAVTQYIGDVKQPPFSGAVSPTGAGSQEALLLAARAINEAATKITTAIQGKAKNFHIFSATQPPTFQRLLDFRFRVKLLEDAFANAGVKATQPATTTIDLAVPGLVTAGLNAALDILGYFKTDYTVGGVNATLNDAILLYSVAAALLKAGTKPYISGFYGPGLQSSIDAIGADLGVLANLRALAGVEVEQLKSSIADGEARATDPANAATKSSILASVQSELLRVGQINAITGLYDGLLTYLGTPDANGVFPITAIASEKAMESAVTGQDTALLLLRLENSGGEYLIKKNFWTGIGAMPLFYMGGATVAYVLLKGSNCEVIGADVIPISAGFVKATDLRGALKS